MQRTESSASEPQTPKARLPENGGTANHPSGGTPPQWNIGIVAHVDAGKTTLTEQMLFQAGAIPQLGRVDHGTAHSDDLAVERLRGISVRSAAQVLAWRHAWIGLVDTPGHVDFAAEVERSLQILDGAILLVSAVDGVQSHTRSLWNALQAMRIPCLICINKVDRVGARPLEVMAELRQQLGVQVVPVQRLVDWGSTQCSIRSLLPSAATFADQEQILEALAETDAAALEAFVEESPLPPDDLLGTIAQQTVAASVTPVFFGAALHGLGVTELLDGILQFVPRWLQRSRSVMESKPSEAKERPESTGTSSAQRPADHRAPLAALVFKLEHHPRKGRRAYIRVFQGIVAIRDSVSNATQASEGKITAVERLQPPHTPSEPWAGPGHLAVIHGLPDIQVGDILGEAAAVPPAYSMARPLIRVQVHPAEDQQFTALGHALEQLSAEDPALALEWWREERELYISMMGSIQMEILTVLLQERFGLAVEFGAPTVIYKERLAQPTEGYVSYTMPKPCWAKLHFRMEPLPPNSGVQFESEVNYDTLPLRYQKQVAAAIPDTLKQGLFGWQVEDLKITLIDGEYHLEHTKAPDFTVATPMGIMDGLQNGGVLLLEPVEGVVIQAPEELTSRILGDITGMRGRFATPNMQDGVVSIQAWIPTAEFLDYPVTLASLSSGRAVLSKWFHGYQEAPPSVRAERKRRGVNPLDRSRWILWVRNALH